MNEFGIYVPFRYQNYKYLSYNDRRNNISYGYQRFLQLSSLIELAGIAITLIIVLIMIAYSIRVTIEYQRAVVFRLSRLLGAKGPGPIFLITVIDRALIVDLRVVT
jgi:hypothetical protein